ncbi:MAG: lamin tail domain-containing protein, partial [Candidatus Marinimicrobia bacterium]|nr:lamin tail domain-containing protein [Candidatus Neomarinimicrobiota bacterium]
NIYSWGENSLERPLTYRILKNQQFKDLYTFFVNKIVTDYFNETTFFQRIDTLKARISSAAYADTYRTIDYGYTVQDFDNSYTMTPGDHVKYGLKPYISTRRQSILSQIQTVNVAPFVIREPSVSLTADGQTIISIDLFDEGQPAEVNLLYKQGGQFVSVPMMLDALIKDGLLTIYQYRILLPNRLTGDELQYFFSLRDSQNKTGLFPFSAPVRTLRFVYSPETPKVFINEFLASNSKINKDDYGEYDDWIEIFNSDTALNLSGWTLTDDPANPAKWIFPDTILSEGCYLLIWADDQPEQGALHVPFKLDKSGGFIGLYQKIEATYTIADSLNYRIQETDFSFGRYPDGGQTRQIMLPTPNGGNISNVIDSNIRLASNFQLLPVFPNPFNSRTQIKFSLPRESVVEITVTDLFGREVLKIPPEHRTSGWNLQQLSFDNMSSGIYFIRVQTGFGNRLMKCVLMK